MDGTSGIPDAILVSPEGTALQRILASSKFQRAPALSRLLVYLWEHRAEPPGEYAIALDVLGKRPDFDPKLDATVRVHVARLRQKLKEFFETEGQDSHVQFSIPGGAYRLEAQNLNPGPKTEATPEAPGRAWQYAALAAIGLCIALAGTALWLLGDNRRLRQGMAQIPRAPELSEFWRRTIGNGKVTRVVFPTPVFFRIGALSVRDATINDPADLPRSTRLRDLGLGPHNPTLSQSYSVSSDTLAVATLTRTLTTGGIPLSVGAARDLSLELFGSDNLLFLGIPHTSQHVEQVLARTEFYLSPWGQQASVRHPLPGEPAVFADARGTRHGIIAVLPGYVEGTRLVLLSGVHTASLASFLASPITVKPLEEYLRAKGWPKFFEMVVAAEVDGFRLLKARPAAFRAVPASLWKQDVTAR